MQSARSTATDVAGGPEDSNDGVRVLNVPGMGAGLFAVADFAPGQVVCRERPLLCYDLLPERDELAARVSAFLAPHRSVSEGGHWGDNCPGVPR